MPKYETYKNSGSEFSGLIPSDWQLLPIRAIFDERNEKNIGPKTDFILSVTRDRGVIPYDEKGAIGNNKSEDIQRYKIVHPNDLVINKMNIVIGSLGLSKYHGALSQVYIVLKPKNSRFNIRYYSYLFSDSTFYKSMIKYCTGIMELRESLDKNHFKKIQIRGITRVFDEPNSKEPFIFNGGCYQCKSIEKFGICRCKGCRYFYSELEKPDLNFKS